jgi:methylmalonyl-CoA mutase
LKHSGKLPIIGVNTFLPEGGSKITVPGEVIRATEEEKKQQINNVRNLQKTWQKETEEYLKKLQEAAFKNENVFEVLMETAKYASIGQITDALFNVGGQYRRNM